MTGKSSTMGQKTDQVVFVPEKGRDYEVRSAAVHTQRGVKHHQEILYRGQWWKIEPHPEHKQTYLLTDPCDPDDENTVQAPKAN